MKFLWVDIGRNKKLHTGKPLDISSTGSVINAEEMPNARECKEKQGHYDDDDSARKLIRG